MMSLAVSWWVNFSQLQCAHQGALQLILSWMGRKNDEKSPQVEIKTGESLISYCNGQNGLGLGKINLIYCQLTIEQNSENTHLLTHTFSSQAQLQSLLLLSPTPDWYREMGNGDYNLPITLCLWYSFCLTLIPCFSMGSPSHGIQSSMNYSNVCPSHGLQLFKNCSSMDTFHAMQFFRNRIHPCGPPMGHGS